jgi:N,N-dimethylformamidase
VLAMPVPIVGYVNRFSAKPGRQIEVKVSSAFAEPYEARLVRIRAADPNPHGPGQKIIDLSEVFKQTFPSRVQAVALGSFARVAHSDRLLQGDSAVTWTALVRPSLLAPSRMAVLSKGDPNTAGVRLFLSQAGIEGEVATASDGRLRAATREPLRCDVWYRIWLSVAPSERKLLVGCQPLDAQDGSAAVEQGHSASQLRIDSAADILFAALESSSGRSHHFEGRIEAPTLRTGFVCDASAAFADHQDNIVAAWDFSVGIDGRTAHDRGPHGLHGTFVNMPTRAVRGAYWSGNEMCWRHAPGDYAAVHFHSDDIEDCGWQTDFTFTVPKNLESGVYGLKLTCNDASDTVPFYVRRGDDAAPAPVVFLASTFTYQAYANHLRRAFDASFRERVKSWGAYPHNTDDHSEFGHSTYNRHPDNTGIAYSSRLWPILTMRPGYLTFNDAKGSGLRHFPADSHLTDWLETKGIDFDVVTDEDLDDEGADLLKPYKVVLTGSHPEYHTGRTLDAIQSYKAHGGRLCYIGGNGFYWRIARNPAIPHVIEVRRAEGGIRTWAAEPGEYYHSLDGQYGGLWRRNMRPPQSIGGVGFSSQGLFEGSYYLRTPDSRSADLAWMFEGISDDKLGDFGLSGGGAAGFELDRADVALGTPYNAVIVARSENHQSHFVAVPEELLTHISTLTGERPQDLIRAEIVYADLPNGGALFAVGSITFCGSLMHNGANNNISRLLENVVRRFAR